MIIQDRTEELRENLKESFKKRISKIVGEAQEIGNKDANSFLSQVQTEIEDHSKQKVAELREEFHQKITGIHLDLDQKIAQKKSELVSAMNEHLILAAANLAVKEKEKLTRKMHKRILRKIKDQGFKVKDFKILVWRGVKINGAISSLRDLAVIAESNTVLIKDSVADLLKDHHNDIIRIISRHVEDNLD
tara:strand:- start:793 stop:1362 length:570 start_codon:yes stop_codon:yes gene_type:complete